MSTITTTYTPAQLVKREKAVSKAVDTIVSAYASADKGVFTIAGQFAAMRAQKFSLDAIGARVGRERARLAYPGLDSDGIELHAPDFTPVKNGVKQWADAYDLPGTFGLTVDADLFGLAFRYVTRTSIVNAQREKVAAYVAAQPVDVRLDAFISQLREALAADNSRRVAERAAKEQAAKDAAESAALAEKETAQNEKTVQDLPPALDEQRFVSITPDESAMFLRALAGSISTGTWSVDDLETIRTVLAATLATVDGLIPVTA